MQSWFAAGTHQHNYSDWWLANSEGTRHNQVTLTIQAPSLKPPGSPQKRREDLAPQVNSQILFQY